MWLQHPHHRQPPAVGNSQQPHASVVARNIFHQPVDRVVSVRALINRFQVFRVAHWPLHHKRSFRPIPPANILKHKNVVVRNHLHIAPKLPAESLLIVIQAVRCALQYNRQRLLRTFRRIDLRMQLHPIPRPNHHFRLIEQQRPVLPLLLAFLRMANRDHNQRSDDNQYQHTSSHT